MMYALGAFWKEMKNVKTKMNTDIVARKGKDFMYRIENLMRLTQNYPEFIFMDMKRFKNEGEIYLL